MEVTCSIRYTTATLYCISDKTQQPHYSTTTTPRSLSYSVTRHRTSNFLHSFITCIRSSCLKLDSRAFAGSSEVFASKRQRTIGDSGAFVTTPQGQAADERDGECPSSETASKGSKNRVDVEEESSKVQAASPSYSWDAAVKAELERYANSVPLTTRTRSRTEDAYRPGPMSHHQLCQAAEEFVKRCHDGNDEDFPLVLVSRNCDDMPSREFELAALQAGGKGVSKLWYALTKTNDLFIVKYASGYFTRRCSW